MPLDFNDVNEDLASPKPVRGIFFEEVEGDRLTVRRVLLGFLLRALNRHPIMNQNSSWVDFSFFCLEVFIFIVVIVIVVAIALDAAFIVAFIIAVVSFIVSS